MRICVLSGGDGTRQQQHHCIVAHSALHMHTTRVYSHKHTHAQRTHTAHTYMTHVHIHKYSAMWEPILSCALFPLQALDGRVERDDLGKEKRFPVLLTAAEKLIARKVVLAFKVSTPHDRGGRKGGGGCLHCGYGRNNEVSGHMMVGIMRCQVT